MNRQRKSLWPAGLGPNTPHDRARAVARSYRALAERLVQRHPEDAEAAQELAVLDHTARIVGEDRWLMPVLTTDTAVMSRTEVARLGGVTVDAVTHWSATGLRRVDDTGGVEHRTLPRRDSAYARPEVEAFLLWRDLTKPYRPQNNQPHAPRCRQADRRRSLP